MAVHPADEKLISCPSCGARIDLEEAVSPARAWLGDVSGRGYVCPNCDYPFTVSDDRGTLRAVAPRVLRRRPFRRNPRGAR